MQMGKCRSGFLSRYVQARCGLLSRHADKCAYVQNKSLVEKVVVLMLEGVDAALYAQHGAQCKLLPALFSQAIPLQFPGNVWRGRVLHAFERSSLNGVTRQWSGNKSHVGDPLYSLLQCGLPRREMARRKQDTPQDFSQRMQDWHELAVDMPNLSVTPTATAEYPNSYYCISREQLVTHGYPLWPPVCVLCDRRSWAGLRFRAHYLGGRQRHERLCCEQLAHAWVNRRSCARTHVCAGL